VARINRSLGWHGSRGTSFSRDRPTRRLDGNSTVHAMRFVFPIARYLLGMLFLFAGIIGFLNLAAPHYPALAMQFLGVLVLSHYAIVIFGVQVVAAILLLINRYVPLALIVLAGVIVNIFTFHVLMAPSGLPLAIIVIALWIVVALDNRSAFDGLLKQTPERPLR
jgi:putative oxidoreductase